MKNLFFLFVLVTVSIKTIAQNNQASDTGKLAVKVVPVLRSYVPPNVVERAIKKYGRSLYCIETTKAINCEESYLVGLIRNGRLSMEFMCEEIKIALLDNKKNGVHKPKI